MNRYEFKAGDTFDLGGDARLLLDGEAVSFAGVTIEATLAAGSPGVPGAGFAQVAGAWLDVYNGLYHVPVDKTVTAAWPIGDAMIDIAFTFGDGRRLTTPTMPFRIVPRVPAPA